MKKVVLTVLLLLCATVAFGFRIPRPQTLTLPLTQEQVNQLNKTLQQLWELQNGEFNLDIVTTSKTKAGAGDIWFIQTGQAVYIQYKANNRVYTVTPQGF